MMLLSACIDDYQESIGFIHTGLLGCSVHYKIFKVILYSYLILKKMNERITDSSYINKYT